MEFGKSPNAVFIQDPVLRPVWDFVIRAPQLHELLEFLKEKRWQVSGASATNTPLINTAGPDDPHLAVFYQKLLAQGMTESDEDRLTAFGDVLLKMRKLKISHDQQQNMIGGQPSSPSVNPAEHVAIRRSGVLDLSKLSIITKYADLTKDRGRRAYNIHDRRFGTGASMIDVVMVSRKS